MEKEWSAYTQLMEALAQRRVQALLQEEIAQERATTQPAVSLLQNLGLTRTAAIVQAAWETAQAYAAYARYDFWAGTQHALAAASYIVTAAKAGGGSALVSAGGAISGATSASAGGAGGAAAGGGTEQRQPTTQIIIQGPIYGGPAGLDELAQKLSEAVTERDVNLTAYTVVRQPAQRA